MSDQDLKVWSSNLIQDAVAKNYQRRVLSDEEFLEGWGRQFGVSAQQVNQLFYLLTSYAAPSDICPHPYPDTAPVTEIMLHMNGQTITEQDAPEVFKQYGATLPDMTANNLAGFIWVVRKH